ncbi:MAG: MBL fold metallo-hydrolase [Clostridia bacterium]|nr:MBL fold metallo-hydrolase [Clostridia bacterium]
MSQSYELTYYMHSGFSLACDDILLVFDYWLGEFGELPVDRRITPIWLRQFRAVYVFISHSHPDHLDPEVYAWQDAGIPIQYIVSYELPASFGGRRVSPGDEFTLEEGLTVKVFDSTDLGVSFLTEVRGLRFFHAGDLNFWHWREESTAAEIDEAEAAFHTACEPLTQEKQIDLACFPVDPRQGQLFDVGAVYFLMTVKPRVLLPMHFWERAEIALEFARRNRSRQSEVIALTQPGERVLIDMEDDGFLNLAIPEMRTAAPTRRAQEGADPFAGSDLPVDLG